MITAPKLVLVLLFALTLLSLASCGFADSISAGAGLVSITIFLMTAAVLIWFVYRQCLAPRIRLRKLYRIRIRQGRRHPLA